MKADHKPTKILIVEDEAIIAMDIESRLIALGYEVVGIAPGGERARQLAATLTPDLMLMDIHIQGPEDGTQVAQSIWKSHNIPSVFLTAFSDEETVARAVLSNPYGYLTKPFIDGELRATVEVAIYKHRTEQQLAMYRDQLEQKVSELEAALQKVRELSALLPICAWCKNIRNEDGYWEEVSSYITKHTNTSFTHGICETCQEKMMQDKGENMP